MRPEITILKLLIEKREENLTIRKISQITEINYRIAYEKISMLEKAGLLKSVKIGATKVCRFTDKFDRIVFEAEYERRSELLKKKDFLVVFKRLSELQFSFIALLFGSHAKGKASKNSDIDILAIGGDEKEIRSAISLLPEKIHLTCVSYKDFINMAKSKEFTVVSETIKNNIILIGIEEYYRLLENAQ